MEILFLISICLLLCHELDAVAKREWTILYVLRSLPEEDAKRWFIWLHLPIFLLLFWIMGDRSQTGWRVFFAAFSVIHSLIHLRLRRRGMQSFNSLFSRWWIDGAAVFGLAYLTGHLVSRVT